MPMSIVGPILTTAWIVWWLPFFFFQAEDGIRDVAVTGVQTCALPISFIDGNKRIAFTATDVFLGRNGFYIDVSGLEGEEFVAGSMNRSGFRLPQILDWIRQHIKPV